MPEHLKKSMDDLRGAHLDWDNGRIEKGNIETLLRGAGKCLGFRLHPHLIRKTMATHAMRRGMPIDQVRVMLGHESIATTTIYVQTLNDNVKESHDKYV
jgi:site-specific recombinase XerD